MILNFLKNSVMTVIMSVITLVSSIQIGPLPERDVYDRPEDCVRVMSFNIHNDKEFLRADIVPKLIGQYYPDSVGVQECSYYWMTTLKAKLHEYAFTGAGRDTGDQRLDCGEISGILYLKNKYTLVDSGTFWLSETPDRVSFGWDAACRRVCTWAVLENKETGVRYAHLNTHLDNAGSVARSKGLDMVLEKALSFDIPTVVTGDF